MEREREQNRQSECKQTLLHTHTTTKKVHKKTEKVYEVNEQQQKSSHQNGILGLQKVDFL